MSSDIQTLLNAVAATGTGTAFDLSVLPGYHGGAHTFVVSGTFVGVVNIEGSIDDGVSWIVLATFTDGGGSYNDGGVYTHIRGNVTAYTSGNITLKARYGLLQDLKADIDTLLARLTSVRAGYLDELAAANLPTDITELLTRLSSGRATLLDNLTRLDVAISTVSATAQLTDLIKQLRKEGRIV